ncbi:MAG TPA: dolichyl-phosphate beta-glucosyltransferase [bacterium]|nr:dolichyl-phosphate beta-glucosyltransferase [bacterium]
MSVVVPAYDEQGRIEDSLLKIKAYMQDAGLGFEIVVVDDGSRDRTPEIVAEFARNDPRIKLVQNRRNLGKGAAVRNGVRSSRGDVVLFSDADLSTPIQEFENLLAWIDSHELVIASRSLPDSKVLVHQPFYREMMGRTYNVFVRTLLVRGLIDTQCGFKLMTRRAADAIFRLQRINSFSFDVEMILIARKMGYSVKEVPVQWVNSRASKVHPVLDSVQMLLDLFRIKFYDISGFYGKRVERE